MASKPKRAVRSGKHKVVGIDSVSVATAVSTNTALSFTSCAARCDSDGKVPPCNRGMAHGWNFQIYAVTTTPVPLELQHTLAAQLVHFTVSVPDFELKALFEFPCVEKNHQKLLQKLRGDQIGLTDCWMKLIHNRDQLNQLLVALIPPTVDDSPFATRRSNQGVTIQLQEQFSELALQLANECEAEHIWSSRLQVLQAMYSKLESVSNAYSTMASRLVGVARCMATMSSSFTIGTRKSPFYLQNFRYLENAALQQLAVQGDDNVELSNRGLTALTTRISSGFVSDSHRQIFFFLESIQEQVQMRRSSKEDETQLSARYEAVVWLVTNHIRQEKLIDALSLDCFDPSDERCHGLGIFPGRWNSQKWSGDPATSLVERLRRQVKVYYRK
ncbi:hypothetical protein PHPALM_1171 [Phytophthora palmivora]|uniref:Uncharacterized protein n=1 Tax=Phytophthora palmivora TaxID=4796 RepID=A0A2P4YT01_9STRA|nr:hypothetical protein PHPALM_1171 [Phytophthora palmivora]